MNKKNLLIQLILLIFMSPVSLFAEEFEINSCPSTIDLFDHMSEQVDTRIEGVTANDTSKKLFTTRGNLTSPWARSSTVWTNNISPIDFTGASPWNSSGGYTRAGTLITPQHIALADHYLLNIGDTVIFITNDNVTISKTITHVQRVGTSDISIAKLNTPVPSSIAHYPIIDKEIFEQYLNDGLSMSTYNLPIVMFDQEDKVLIKNIKKSDLISDNTLDNDYHWQSNRQQFNELLIGGDSGNPGFVLIGDIPVLILTHHTASYGPSYPYYKSDIQDIIDGWGGGYELSTINLSCFNAPTVLEKNTTLSVSENAATSTVIGTIGVKYNVENDTPYFSFLSGNDNGALAINSSTGQITVASSSLVTSAVFPKNVEVEVEENGPGGKMSKETYYIKLNAYPYFNVDNYSFNTIEHSNAGTSVGSVTAYDAQNDTLQYSILSGNSNGIFSINPLTGVITVASSTLLNYETDTAHTLVVRAQEAVTIDHLYKDINVNIAVNDINYTFSSLYTYQIQELIENGNVVGSVIASIADPIDIGSVYYEVIGGNTDSIFTLSSSTGQVSVNNNDYLDGNDIYNLSIGVKDGSGGTVINSAPVTIKVSKDDRPTISFEQQAQSLVSYSVEEGSSVNITLQLSAPYTKTIVANLFKTLGSAILNTDYTLSTDTITFLPGETSKTVIFNALTDSVSEGNESLLLNIVDNTRVSLGPRQNATININNKNVAVSSGGGGSFNQSVSVTSTNVLVNKNQNLNQNTLLNNKIYVNNNIVNNYTFSKSLTLNSINEDVKVLQKFLNSQGFIVSKNGPGSKGFETTKFGPATRKALAEFQAANKIYPAKGYFGPVTKKIVNKMLNSI